MRAAVEQLIEQGRVLAEHALGNAAEGPLDWSELARHALERPLRAEARFDSDLVFSSGAYAAAVEIDPETGKLTVRRIVAVDDAGTVINPLLAHGQIIGGAIQGLGECLTEEAVYDDEGQLRTATFMDYGLLTTGDVPEVVIGEVSTPSPRNPLGAKGVGEGGDDRGRCPRSPTPWPTHSGAVISIRRTRPRSSGERWLTRDRVGGGQARRRLLGAGVELGVEVRLRLTLSGRLPPAVKYGLPAITGPPPGSA